MISTNALFLTYSVFFSHIRFFLLHFSKKHLTLCGGFMMAWHCVSKHLLSVLFIFSIYTMITKLAEITYDAAGNEPLVCNSMAYAEIKWMCGSSTLGGVSILPKFKRFCDERFSIRFKYFLSLSCKKTLWNLLAEEDIHKRKGKNSNILYNGTTEFLWWNLYCYELSTSYEII